MKTPIQLTAVAILLWAPIVLSQELPDFEDTFAKDVLIIETQDRGCFRFDVYIAVTGAQQRRGLMFVRDLPEWTGMLFIYERADIRGIWMKNTYIPLDIIFVRGDGTVSSIVANAEPLSLTSMPSSEPVNFVLELNAGTAERLSIKVGSHLLIDGVR
jgi:uncharacterized membrane protein (UPF0127 family)